MTIKQAMHPRAAGVVPSALPLPSTPAMARRGFLRALARLAPVAALAAGGATVAISPASAAPTGKHPALRENRRLVWLGEQLDAVDAQFTAAVGRRDQARAVALAAWPQPAADIVFPPGVRPPAWCGVQDERDVDDKVLYFAGHQRAPRKIADAFQLEFFLKHEDRRARDARAAKRLLPLAQKYESDRAAVIEASGYGCAKDELWQVARRIDRIAGLIYKIDGRTAAGLMIKARAMKVALRADGVDHCIVHRSKTLYAEKLADQVLRLATAA